MTQTDTPPDVKRDPAARKLISVARNGGEWKMKWSHGTEVQSLTCKDLPNPELPAELEGLHKYAMDAAAYIDKKYHDKTVVLGVSFDWKGDDERRNAVVHLDIDMGQNGHIPVKTPKKLADNALDEKKKGRWDTNAVAQFDKLVLQAFAYIDGERSQQEMPIFDKTKAGKKVKQEEGFDFENELQTQGTA